MAYGMNGEAVRPQQGFPLRLMVPGFEGIFHTKYLRRIKVVDRYYMNYNDYGHLDQDAKDAALGYQIGPKSVITFPSGGQQLPGRGFYEISGLAWSGGGAIKQGGGVHRRRQALEQRRDSRERPQRMAHTRFGYQWNWDGKETELLSRCTDELGQVQPSRAQVAKFWNEPFDATFSVPGLDNTIQPWRIASDGSVHQWASLRVLPFALLAHGRLRAGAVADVWCGTHAERRGNPRVGYLHRSDRRGTPAGARNRQGGRAALSREGVRGMPRGDGDRGHGAQFEKQEPARMSSSGNGDESCRFARRSRRRCGITSIAPCLSIERGR